MDSRYFAALSISSLDSADEHLNGFSDYGSNITQTELYHQLSYIEELASNFFVKRPQLVTKDRGYFAEIEHDNYQDFEFRLSDFGNDDILALTITCIPNAVWKEDGLILEREKVQGVDFQLLEFSFYNSDSDSGFKLPVKAALYNAEYCITLSKAHGLRGGQWLLRVQLSDQASKDAVQTVRVSYNIQTAVRAVPVEVDKPVCDEVYANEFKYYRFVLQDPSKVFSVSCRALGDDDKSSREFGAASSDPDLYVSNRHEGLVGVSRESAQHVWRSTSAGSDRVDIFPDDMHLRREASGKRATESTVLIIGVLGYREVNRYELVVTLAAQQPVVAVPASLEARNKVLSCSVSTGVCYSLAVDQASRDAVVVVLQHSGALVPGFLSNDTLDAHHISRRRGRAVHLSDSLDHCADSLRANRSGCNMVTVYLSSSTKHPSAGNHMWQVSALTCDAPTIFHSLPTDLCRDGLQRIAVPCVCDRL